MQSGSTRNNGILKNSINDFAMTTNDVWEENGYLVFKDQETYDLVVNSLRELNGNDDYYRDAIIQLGFDPDNENDDDLEPIQPALKLFEDRFTNFNSLRSSQEAAEELYLQQEGADPINFPGHFWKDPYLMTMMNEDLEIRISEYIIKQVDEYNSIILTDNSSSNLNYIRTTPFGEVEEKENLVLYNFLNPEKRKLFENGIPKIPECVARFKMEFLNSYNGRDYYEIKSVSFNISSNVQYDWNFGGGLNANSAGTYTANGLNGANPGVISFPTNGYPFIVTLNLTLEASNCNSSFSYSLPNPTNCYGHFTVTDDPEDGDHIFFDVTTSLGSPLQFDWNFGDNTGLVNAGAHVDHTYFNSSNVTVTLVTTSGSCTSVESQNIVVGCGHLQYFKELPQVYNNSGRRLLYSLKLTNTLFHHSICAKSTNYKWVNGWKKHKSDILKAGWTGSFYLKHSSNGNCQVYNHGSTNVVTNRKTVDFTYQSSNHQWFPTLSMRTGDIKSTHYAEDNNSNSGYKEIISGQ